MQKDIASRVAQSLNEPAQIKQLIEVIKNQLTEIQKRGDRIVDLEDKNEMLQKNLSIIAASNKQLETMIETLRSERVKLLEEIEELKNSKPSPSVVQKTKKVKQKVEERAQ